MSKFCKSCGSEMPDNIAFCGVCGTALNAPEEPTAQPFANGDYNAPVGGAQKNKKPLILGAAIGGAVIVAVLLVLFLIGSGPESALDKMVDYTTGDVDVLEDLAPKAYWDYVEMCEGESVEELIEEARSDMEEYGGMYESVEYDVLDEKDISDLKIRKINEYLVEKYGFEADAVEDACELTYSIFAVEENDTDSETNTDIIVKIDGEWYIARATFDDGELEWFDFLVG